MASRWMMIDGKLNPRALSALYVPGMTEEVVALLQGTVYAPLAASGPLLARLESNSGLQAHWQNNEPPARHAWCFTSDLALYPLIDHWRRRLLWRGPMGRTLWLRYADARVMARGIEHAVFPAEFWHAMTSIRLAPWQGQWSPLPDTRQSGWQEPGADTLTPGFALNEPQLAALSAKETAS